MADKVNIEESVARVYQFLNRPENTNWKEEVDYNGDGVIVKSEFINYLYKGFKFNNGENKEDLVDAFWKTIDFKTKGKVARGCNASNKLALDAQEIQRMEDSIEATQKINSFMRGQQVPEELEAKYKDAWKKSVKEGLIYRASEYLKTGSLSDITEEWLNEAFRESSIKATADYTAAAEKVKQLGNVDDYAVGDDELLTGLVDNYVAQLEGSSKDNDTVINEVKALISAYADTANTNSDESVNLLVDYGYNPDDLLNKLQYAVLKKELTGKILNYIKENNSDIYVDGFKEQIEAAIKDFVEELLYDKFASEFSELKSLDASEFSKTSAFNTLVENIKAEQEKIRTARDELNTYIGQILAERNSDKTAAVKEIIGTIEAEGILKRLLLLKTFDEIKAKQKELEAAIKAIDRRLPDDFLKDLPESISCVSGAKVASITLPQNYGTEYQYGDLHYREITGCSAITVSEAGVVTVNSSHEGQWIAQIEVLDNDGNVVSGPKSISVNILKAMKLEESDKAFNDQAISYIMSTGQNAVQLSGFNEWSTAKVKAKQSIKTYVNNIMSILQPEGYDLTRLQIAAKNTIAYYNAVIDAIEDKCFNSGEGMFDVVFTYVDNEGKTHTENSTFSQKTRHMERDAGRTNEGALNISQNSTGIRMNESYSGTNTYEYYLNSAVLLRKFQEFYNMY